MSWNELDWDIWGSIRTLQPDKIIHRKDGTTIAKWFIVGRFHSDFKTMWLVKDRIETSLAKFIDLGVRRASGWNKKPFMYVIYRENKSGESEL